MKRISSVNRWWRFVRRHRLQLGIAALLTLVLLSAVVVIALRNGNTTESDAWQDPWDWSDPAGAALCEQNKTREPCLGITLGSNQVRYALLKSETPTAETVLIDLGGPGVSVLSGSHNLALFHSAYPRLQQFNLLFLEEPWVTQAPPEGCDTALSYFYRQLRAEGDIAGSARAMAMACQISQPPGQSGPGEVPHRAWGFDDVLYADSVWNIARRHALKLHGFVGHSWGSIRLGYLQSGIPAVSGGTASSSWPDFDWIVLIRPMPITVAATDVIGQRKKIIGPVEGEIADTPLDTRSLPVTRFDQLSALLALGYVEDEYLGSHAEQIRLGRLPVDIGRLSDGLWHRYGTDSISAAMLAQWQETCAILGSVDVPHSIDSVDAILAAMFAPCQADLDQAFAASVGALRSCVVVSANDTVIPEALNPRHSLAGREIIESNVAQHGSFDGLNQCLEHAVP